MPFLRSAISELLPLALHTLHSPLAPEKSGEVPPHQFASGLPPSMIAVGDFVGSLALQR
jgi:hypothetical protein